LKVNDETAKQRILAALSDSYSRQIKASTVEEPLIALELSRKYTIPIDWLTIGNSVS